MKNKKYYVETMFFFLFLFNLNSAEGNGWIKRVKASSQPRFTREELLEAKHARRTWEEKQEKRLQVEAAYAQLGIARDKNLDVLYNKMDTSRNLLVRRMLQNAKDGNFLGLQKLEQVSLQYLVNATDERIKVLQQRENHSMNQSTFEKEKQKLEHIYQILTQDIKYISSKAADYFEQHALEYDPEELS